MKGLKLYLIIGGLILFVYAAAEFNRPREVDWNDTYSDKDKIPFGTYILFHRINDIFPGAQITSWRKPVYNVVAEDSGKKKSYIIVCKGLAVSKVDYEALINYVKQGNDVFIASETFGKVFEKDLDIQVSSNMNLNSKSSPVRFLNPTLNSGKKYSVDKVEANVYFSKFDTTRAVVLGENNERKANFIKFNLGKGSMYFITNPKFFSNYSLLKADGAAYSAKALSYIKNTKHIAWDEYYTQGSDDGDDSPMRVFFGSAALQWAYYIALGALIIFVLYEIKRRQRIIPVVEPLNNSTLDFVNVVGQVYYENRNNTNIAHKKILYFFEQLRDQYQVRTNNLDDEFIETLKTKLGIEAKLAHEFVEYVRYIDVQERVTDNELINLNSLIEKINSQTA